jgi:enamine deaminase RidA (YjgF/YER057c/UK114 family)
MYIRTDDPGATTVQRRVINPWNWQDSQGWSWAIEVSGGKRALFCAGQVPVDGTGRVLHRGNMRGQIAAVLDNLETVLAAAGYGLGDVVRLDYYATDVDRVMANWDVVKDRFASVGRQPGGVLLGVSRLASPELMIEIQATAVAD